MKKMIKLFAAALVALTAAASAAFAEPPEFNEPGVENAFVADLKPGKGQVRDYVQIINFSDDTTTTFKIWGYSKNGWVYVGESKVQPYGESNMLESEYDHKLWKFTHLAIAATNGKKYTYVFSKFTIHMYIADHYVGSFRILPENQTPGKNAYIVENASVKGSFKDNIKVTAAPNTSVKVYASNDKENWILIAGGTTKDEDSSTLELTDEKNASKYKFYAIETIDGTEHTYKLSKAHNDLYIEVK